MPRILIADDDAALLIAVSRAFRQDGYEVDTARDGLEAVFAFLRRPADLAVLDILMPKADGFEVMEALRREAPNLPMLFISSQTEEEDRIHGFALGADDYITKPFSIAELRMRVRAILRRAAQAQAPAAPEAPVLRSGPYTFDLQRFRLYLGDEAVTLSPREMRLLEALLRHSGAICSREDLLATAWPADAQPSPRSVDVHLARLRAKIDPHGEIRPIFTLPGEGYRWALDLEPAR